MGASCDKCEPLGDNDVALCPLHAEAKALLDALEALGRECSHCDWWHAQSCTHWEARDECQENCRAARAVILRIRQSA